MGSGPYGVTMFGWSLRDSTPFLPVMSVMSARLAKSVAIFYSHPATLRPRTNVLQHPFQILPPSSPAVLSLHARLSQSGRTLHKPCIVQRGAHKILPRRPAGPRDRGRPLEWTRLFLEWTRPFWSGHLSSGVEWTPIWSGRAPSMLVAGKCRVRRGLLVAAPELQNTHATLKGRSPPARSPQHTSHLLRCFAGCSTYPCRFSAWSSP